MKSLREFKEKYNDSVDEGVGIDMLKHIVPKKLLHKWKQLNHVEQYKVAIKYYWKLKKDSRNLTDQRRLVIAAAIVGIPPREFKKVLDKETRYESNANGQTYITPSVKDTGKVLEDGLPETVRAYKNMTPGQTTEEETIIEKAPPDAEIEDWIEKNKERFVAQYGEDEYAPYLYGRAWNMYNKKHDINT